jgi:TPR repeat protein
VFSYGFVIYHLLFGRDPRVEGLTFEKMMGGERPAMPTDAMAVTCDLISRCWDVNPDFRPSFDAIVGLFHSQGHCFLPGVDDLAFGEYRRKVMHTFIFGQAQQVDFEVCELVTDPKLQRDQIKECADAGNIRAMMRHAEISGDLSYLKGVADSGHKNSQFKYSEKCQDAEEAMKYLQQSAELGYLRAIEVLAERTGDVNMFKRAADQGSGRCQFEYYRRTGKVEYLRMASQNSIPEAVFELADLEQKGRFQTVSGSYPMFAQEGLTHEEIVQRITDSIPNEISKNFTDSIRLMVQAFSLDVPAAKTYIDELYKSGRRASIRPEGLLRANRGRDNVDQLILYAILLAENDRDFQLAHRLFRVIADHRASPDAQYQLYLLQPNKELKISEAQARQFLQRAAEQGHVTAAYTLANILANPTNISKVSPSERTTALRFYRFAAQSGDPLALTKYGLFASQSKFHPLADVEAAAYFRIAADRGDPQAQFYYGSFLESGRGIPMNPWLAKTYYKLGIKQGSFECMRALCELYQHVPELKKTPQTITRWLFRVGSYCSARELLMVGDRLSLGIGCAPNRSCAVLCYRLGALLGNADAQFKYGEALFYGRGLTTDQMEAVHFFRLAAINGSVDGQRQLGQMYFKGSLVPFDLNAARGFLKQAADSPDARGQYEYAILLLEIDPELSAEAVDYLVRAAEQQHLDACLKLARLYDCGDLIPHNAVEASKWYRKAGELTGNQEYFDHAAVLNSDEISPFELGNLRLCLIRSPYF